MLLVLAAILLIVSIDYVLGNKISDTISEYIERICIKLCNENPADVNQTLDVDKENKETVGFFMKPKYIDKKDFLPMQGGLPVTTPLFNVPIPFNTSVNILEMVGLNKERWIVDWKSGFELSIQGQSLDLTNFCDNISDHMKTIIFLRGENRFTLNINCETGDTFIKTNSKAFETEITILVFKAESIQIPKSYYGKATLELARMAQKILEESENNKIGDDNV